MQESETLWENWLGQQRLDSYQSLRPNLAIEDLAYWNQHLSGLLLIEISHVEIALRNLMAGALQRRIQARGFVVPWFEDPTRELRQCGGAIAISRIQEAVLRAKRVDRPVHAGDVVAELSLGFWAALLSKDFQRFHPDLVSIFRGAKSRNVSQAHFLVSRVLRLQNRAAHQHRMIHRDLYLDHKSIVELASAIDPALAKFLHERSQSVSQIDEYMSPR